MFILSDLGQEFLSYDIWQSINIGLGSRDFFGNSDGDVLLNGMEYVYGTNPSALTTDPRFSIPAYMGHNGWVRLRFDAGFDQAEVQALVLESYRHFALKRMLMALDAGR